MAHWKRLPLSSSTAPANEDVTGRLVAARAGDRDAADQLMQAAYKDLRKKAAAFLRRERLDQEPGPTGGASEA
jgi:hypothetical protein